MLRSDSPSAVFSLYREPAEASRALLVGMWGGGGGEAGRVKRTAAFHSISGPVCSKKEEEEQEEEEEEEEGEEEGKRRSTFESRREIP